MAWGNHWLITLFLIPSYMSNVFVEFPTQQHFACFSPQSRDMFDIHSPHIRPENSTHVIPHSCQHFTISLWILCVLSSLLVACMPRPHHRLGERREERKGSVRAGPTHCLWSVTMRPYKPHHRKSGGSKTPVSASDMGHQAVKRLSSWHPSVR